MLAPADISRLAALHCESIDDSLPALLGRAYAERLYRFLAVSPLETLVVERVGDRIEAGCVLSHEPGTLQGRLARATLPALALHACVACFARADFRRWLRGFASEALRGAHAEPRAPEIVYLFTNGELRSRGLGRRLVERVDAELARLGADVCYVRTLDDPANRAIAFYERNGFARLGVEREGGRRFVVLRRKLAPG